MTTQLDLFGDATEQTSAPATVLVRSHLRVTRGAGTQVKPALASCAPQPAKIEPPAGEAIAVPKGKATTQAFNNVAPVPHNGTATSKAAARHMEQAGAAMTQEARVLAAVQASGARGLTREDIHHATGISVASVCGRVNTLLRKGMLGETGETRRSSAGVIQAVVASKKKDTDHEQ